MQLSRRATVSYCLIEQTEEHRDARLCSRNRRRRHLYRFGMGVLENQQGNGRTITRLLHHTLSILPRPTFVHVSSVVRNLPN